MVRRDNTGDRHMHGETHVETGEKKGGKIDIEVAATKVTCR